MAGSVFLVRIEKQISTQREAHTQQHSKLASLVGGLGLQQDLRQPLLEFCSAGNEGITL